jgi:hypothetical protein
LGDPLQSDLTEDGAIRWRRVDLRERISRRFGVAMHALGKMLSRLKFRHMSVRPQHPRSNEAAQDGRFPLRHRNCRCYDRHGRGATAKFLVDDNPAKNMIHGLLRT